MGNSAVKLMLTLFNAAGSEGKVYPHIEDWKLLKKTRQNCMQKF